MLDAGCQIVERCTTSFDFLRCGRCTVYRPSKYVYVSFNLGVRVERARWRQGGGGTARVGHAGASAVSVSVDSSIVSASVLNADAQTNGSGAR